MRCNMTKSLEKKLPVKTLAWNSSDFPWSRYILHPFTKNTVSKCNLSKSGDWGSAPLNQKMLGTCSVLASSLLSLSCFFPPCFDLSFYCKTESFTVQVLSFQQWTLTADGLCPAEIFGRQAAPPKDISRHCILRKRLLKNHWWMKNKDTWIHPMTGLHTEMHTEISSQEEEILWQHHDPGSLVFTKVKTNKRNTNVIPAVSNPYL